MKYLLIGSNGFIGKNVAKLLSEESADVFLADRENADKKNSVFIDLFDKESIKKVLLKVNPDIVLNMAGSVENTEKVLEINPVFTKNLLDCILELKELAVKKIIITGSAGEYGEVEGEGPVDENTPLLGKSFYARSKIMETKIAGDYKEKYNLPINIVRIFNPVGAGMHPRFLIPSIIRQIEAVNRGEKNYIEISRLDSSRDYINIKDIARAIILISQKEKTKYYIYNLGSGITTSNGQLIRQSLQLECSRKNIEIRQTSENPENRVANQADIARLKNEFGWTPEVSLKATIKEIVMNDQSKHKINLLIIGAGEAGRLISGNITKDSDSSLKVVGFIDDDVTKIGKSIDAIPVLGNVADLKMIVRDNNIKEILIAIPSGRGVAIRNIVENSIGLGLVYKILPRKSEVLLQDFDKDYIKYIRRVEPEDLLGGTISKSDQDKVKDYIRGKSILITGAAGSIGSELSRQLVAYGPDKIVFYDWWEYGMFDLQNHIVKNYPNANTSFIIGDIKDRKKLNTVMACFKPDSVFHAAAYKHVPLMELNATEAIKNNIFGTKNIAELSIKHGVEKFVLVSTDKAVNPTNIMGATKRAAEKITHIFGESQNETIFCSVRFGNVINSNGSAIPIFEQQINSGGPVTVTHKEMTRYFMTVPESVHLILQAWIMGKNNDLFVLDMGEPIKIYDLARLLITIRGYIPEEEIAIKFIGLRPGEKLYEEILVDDESTSSTRVEKIFKTKNYLDFNKLAFFTSLSILAELAEEGDFNTNEIKSMLKKMISTYAPKEDKQICEIN